MPDVRLDLAEETLETVAIEADVLGFDSVRAYLQWLVDNRLSVAVDGERGTRLAAYGKRFEEIRPEAESQVDAAASAADDIAGPPSPESPTGDASPDRRMEDTDLEAAAAALRTVEEERVDVFAQRALTSTRRRLGDVGTGIDYRSSASLEGDDRPGSDITDLDGIDVPGWDETTVERRRDAVGAALAFLKDREEAKRSDFVDELYADYPADYDTESAWWECVKRGLRQVDRVVPAGEDSRIWRFDTTPGRVTRISFV